MKYAVSVYAVKNYKTVLKRKSRKWNGIDTVVVIFKYHLKNKMKKQNINNEICIVNCWRR